MPRETIRLNGAWKIRFDPNDRGKDAGWFLNDDFASDRTIDVPSTWNEIQPGYEGVAWYATEFPTPADGLPEYWLRFGAVNYGADVWLNGMFVGSHQGGYTPFELAVTFPMKPAGEPNRLVVRVWDPPSTDLMRRIDGASFCELPAGKEGWYYNFSGIWQGVELIASEETYLRELFVEADIAGNRVRVSALARTPGEEQAVLATVRVRDAKSGKTVAEHAAETVIPWGSRLLRVEVPLDAPAKLWDLESPHLYTAEFELSQDDEEIDTVSTRFGMREFAIRDKRFCLNGEPLPVKGILDQQWYPVTAAYPKDPRQDLELMQQAGFNMIRIHIRPTMPEVLDAADEMGLLIFEEPAIGWIAPSPMIRQRAMTEVSEMILRDRNHPSIVMWGLFNEGSCRGAPDLFGRSYVFGADRVGPTVQTYKSDLVRQMRFLDPTRLILDDSAPGSERCYPPGSDEPEKLTDTHIYRSAPAARSVIQEYRTSGPDEHLYFVSEFGNGGFDDYGKAVAKYPESPDSEDKLQLAHYHKLIGDYYEAHLTDLFASQEDLYAATLAFQADSTRRLVELQRTNPKAAGYVWTQLADGSWENQAGLVNVWREPKPALEAVREANAPLRAVVFTGEHNVEPGQAIPIEVAIVNDTKRTGSVPLRVLSKDAAGQTLFKQQLRIELPKHIDSVHLPEMTASAAPGWIHTTVTLGKEPPTSWTNYVIEPGKSDTPPGPVGMVLCPDPLREHLKGLGINETGARADRILVGPIDSFEALNGPELGDVMGAVRGGATAFVLGLPWGTEPVPEGEHRCWCFPKTFYNEVFPFPIRYARSENLFMSQMHFMRPHPWLEGLTSGALVDTVWANLLPGGGSNMTGGGDAVVLENCQEIAGWFGVPASHHQRIKGCTWDRCRFGQTLCIVPLGKGRLVFSGFKIVDELSTDPAARRLLWNLVTVEV